MAGRQSRGRQRIPVRLIENHDHRYVTFSKRRLGLYNKASELSTLCNVDVGIIIYSPTDKPFSFFTPNMESVMERYRNPHQPLNGNTQFIEAHTRTRIEDLNRQVDDMLEEKEHVTECEKQLEEIDQTRPKEWWQEVPIESLTKEQVKEWKTFFQNFKARVQSRIEEVRKGAGPSLAVPVFRSLPSFSGADHTSILQPEIDHLEYGGMMGCSEFQFSTLYNDAHIFPPPPFGVNDGSGHVMTQRPHFFTAPTQDPSGHVSMWRCVAPSQSHDMRGHVPNHYFAPPFPSFGHSGGPYYGFMPPPYSGDGSGDHAAGSSRQKNDDS